MGDFLKNLASSGAGAIANAGSGLLNFGLGQIGAAIQWKREKQKMQMQQDYALEQMAQSQQYNLDNMAKQNEYQIAAEDRANAFNSVGAQVERARQAGVSPMAALGSGGAGGTMSVSSAPTGGSPSGSAPSGGVPSSGGAQFFDLARGIELGASVALKSSQQALVDEQRRGLEFDNLWKQIDSEFAPQYTNNKRLELDVIYLRKQLEKAYVTGGKSSPQYQMWMEELNNLKADTGVKENTKVSQMSLADYYDAAADYYVASASHAKEQTRDLFLTRESRVKQALNYAFQAYESGILARRQAATEAERKNLVAADTEVAKSRKVEIDKQVERIGKLNNLTDQQIRQIKHKIGIAWAKFGVDTAVAVSQEARGWIYPYSDAFKKKGSSFSSSPTDWADDTGYNPFYD